MNKTLKILLIISLIGNCCIFYVAYKAIEYRTHINHFLEKYRYVSKEFSERDRYASENLSLQSDSTVSNRILFFGTQVTKKYDLKRHFPEYKAINRGVTGQRVAGYLLRFKPDVIDLSPNAVILEISSYNFRPENTIEEIKDYTELLTQLSLFHNIKPILTTVLKPREEFINEFDIKEFGDYNPFDSVETYNTWLREYTQENDISLVDFQKLLSDKDGYLKEEYSINLVEPNESGYTILTSAIKEKLEK